MSHIEQLRGFILDWDKKYPLDLYLRKKNKISFNSDEHRKINFADVCLDIIEDITYKQIYQKRKAKQKYRETGEWLEPDNSEKDRELIQESLKNLLNNQ